jgi:hypothetical protein
MPNFRSALYFKFDSAQGNNRRRWTNLGDILVSNLKILAATTLALSLSVSAFAQTAPSVACSKAAQAETGGRLALQPSGTGTATNAAKLAETDSPASQGGNTRIDGRPAKLAETDSPASQGGNIRVDGRPAKLAETDSPASQGGNTRVDGYPAKLAEADSAASQRSGSGAGGFPIKLVDAETGGRPALQPSAKPCN